MVDFKTVHRLAAIGAVAFLAIYLGLIAVFLDQPPLLTTAWRTAIATEDGFHVVRLLIIIISILAFMMRDRSSALGFVFLVLLVVVPVGWVVWDILYRARGVENGEYWRYFLEPTMFRWLVAPWLADYSFTLVIACLGLWMVTLPRSSRQILGKPETGI